MRKIFTMLFIVALTINVNAQKNEKAKPIHVGKVTSMVHVSSIASRPHDQIPADMTVREAKDKRSGQNKVIIGKDPQTTNDYFTLNRNKLEQKVQGRSPSLVFDATFSNSQPTDPALAVGPNHVIVVYNTGFRIFDKNGTGLTAQMAPNPAIFPTGGCCDLTASYDSAADRWVISFLGSGAQIAVSDGPDPVNDGWYVYTINAISDYQKLSVWRDGYYLTENTGSSNKVHVLERAKALVGDNSAGIASFPLPGMVTSGFHAPQALNITDDNYPTAGGATFVYLQDDAWGGVSQDHIKIWTLDMDWTNIGNSTMSAAQTINTTPFISVFDGGGFSNLTQPGGGVAIDAIQATIMNQAQFRKFGSYNSALFNFVVDTDAGAGELAGIRWIELRQANDTAPWTLYQEGTYTSPNGKHAWMGSLMMDAQGNIGMGYSAMGGTNNKFVGSYYTGRFANDPLGTMSIAEEVIREGTTNIPGLRYGDYSKIDIDPIDDLTFWFANELMRPSRRDVVGVFKIAPDTTNDVGIVSIDSPTDGSLSANEDVVVTVFNYGSASQSNVPVNLTVNGSVVATGTVPGPIASSSSVQYTFSGIDLSIEGQIYTVVACTTLGTDENNANNCTTTSITHLNSSDLGVIAITAPTSGESLGSESITITIENFGGVSQSNFMVSYTLNGGTPVTETVAGPLAPGATMSYTFTTPGDFSAVTSHTLTASTQLAGDGDTSNDSTTVTVVNVSCISQTNSTSQSIGPNGGTTTTSVINFTDSFTINDVNLTINANHTYVGDLVISLTSPGGTTVQLTNSNGTLGDDNLINTTFDDEASSPFTSGSGPFTGSWQPLGNLSDFDLENSAGNWTLEILDFFNGDGGTLNNWTLQLCGDTTASVTENLFDENDFIVATLPNNQYNVSVNTSEVTERLTFSVTNMIGQTLVSYNLDNVNGGYEYDLDMSYASPGVYILRLGNAELGNTKKIIVK